MFRLLYPSVATVVFSFCLDLCFTCFIPSLSISCLCSHSLYVLLSYLLSSVFSCISLFNFLIVSLPRCFLLFPHLFPIVSIIYIPQCFGFPLLVCLILLCFYLPHFFLILVLASSAHCPCDVLFIICICMFFGLLFCVFSFSWSLPGLGLHSDSDSVLLLGLLTWFLDFCLYIWITLVTYTSLNLSFTPTLSLGLSLPSLFLTTGADCVVVFTFWHCFVLKITHDKLFKFTSDHCYIFFLNCPYIIIQVFKIIMVLKTLNE